MLVLGKHVILELMNVKQHYLNKVNFGLSTLREAVFRANATIICESKKVFPNGGYTIVIGLEESHITIHTWPEHNYAAVDIFMCGNSNIDIASDHIIKVFSPEDYHKVQFDRGIKDSYVSMSHWGLIHI